MKLVVELSIVKTEGPARLQVEDVYQSVSDSLEGLELEVDTGESGAIVEIDSVTLVPAKTRKANQGATDIR